MQILIRTPVETKEFLRQEAISWHLKEELNITYLNLLFDSNPFLLSKEKFEIKEFVSKKEKEGLTKEDIKDLIESNPYVIDEV